MRVLLGMRLTLFYDARFKFVDVGFHSYFTVLSRVFVSLAVAVCAACSQGIVLQVLSLLCVLSLSLFVFCVCVVFGTCLFVVVSDLLFNLIDVDFHTCLLCVFARFLIMPWLSARCLFAGTCGVSCHGRGYSRHLPCCCYLD